MGKKYNWILFIGLVLIVALILFIVWLMIKDSETQPKQYLSNKQYAKPIGIPSIMCTYADYVANTEGNYQTRKCFSDDATPYIVVLSDGIDYYFYPDTLSTNATSEEQETYRLSKIIITGINYKFGRMDIGVGSTKDEVEHAYRKNLTCYAVDGLGSGYIDGNWLFVRFLYDQFGKVIQMSINVD